MARIDKKGNIRGILGNTYFRFVNGQQLIQSKPIHKKQTAESKASAQEFALVSKTSKLLRRAIQQQLHQNHDPLMYRRFNAALYRILKANRELPRGIRNFTNSSFQSLIGFEFNENSLFIDYFYGKIYIKKDKNTKITIQIEGGISEKLFKTPEKSNYIQLKFHAIHFNFSTNVVTQVAEKILSIPLHSNALIQDSIHFPLSSEPDTFVLIAELQYYQWRNNKMVKHLNSKKFNPSCILFIRNNNT